MADQWVPVTIQRYTSIYRYPDQDEVDIPIRLTMTPVITPGAILRLAELGISTKSNSWRLGDVVDSVGEFPWDAQIRNLSYPSLLTDADTYKIRIDELDAAGNKTRTAFNSYLVCQESYTAPVDLLSLSPIAVSATTSPMVKGDTGLSAYQLAVLNGYSGTLTQWLNSFASSTGLNNHVASTTPHPAYDDMPDLRLYYENGKA